MTSGFSGLPKLRQSVTPSGSRAAADDVARRSRPQRSSRRRMDRAGNSGCCSRRSARSPWCVPLMRSTAASEPGPTHACCRPPASRTGGTPSASRRCSANRAGAATSGRSRRAAESGRDRGAAARPAWSAARTGARRRGAPCASGSTGSCDDLLAAGADAEQAVVGHLSDHDRVEVPLREDLHHRRPRHRRARRSACAPAIPRAGSRRASGPPRASAPGRDRWRCPGRRAPAISTDELVRPAAPMS